MTLTVRSSYIIPIFIPHRACPHRCVFCDQNIISGSRGYPTVAEITATVSKYLANMPQDASKEVAFYGGSFTGLPFDEQQQLLAAADQFFQMKQINGIRISTRPDYIDNQRVELLHKYHVKVVELGVQSFDDVVLSRSGRGHTAQHSREAVRMLDNAGFKVAIQLMPGLPGSTWQSDLQSVRQTVELMPEFCRIYPTVVLKNTPLEEIYRQGKYLPMNLETAINLSKQAVVLLRSAAIEVIRVGLHPSAQLEQMVLAGPYHQSFGDLVRTRMFYDLARRLIINSNVRHGSVEIYAGAARLSSLVGFRRLNALRLAHEFPHLSIAMKSGQLTDDQLQLVSSGEVLGRLDLSELY